MFKKYDSIRVGILFEEGVTTRSSTTKSHPAGKRAGTHQHSDELRNKLSRAINPGDSDPEEEAAAYSESLTAFARRATFVKLAQSRMLRSAPTLYDFDDDVSFRDEYVAAESALAAFETEIASSIVRQERLIAVVEARAILLRVKATESPPP